jgi:MFS family permease
MRRFGKKPAFLPYHGWLVVAAAFLVALYGFGLGFYGPGIYLAALKALHGWPTSELSSAITTYYVLGATLLFFWVGPLFDRHGARKVVVVGTIAMACGVMLLALVTQPWHAYAAFAVMSVGWATMSGAAINIIVAPWFDRRRGLAVSWALNGASAGGIIIAPLLTFLIARFGFPFAIASVSASMLVTLIPVAMVVLRRRNADEYDPVERAADPDTAPQSSTTSAANATGFRLVTLLRSGVFISISVPFALGLTAQVGFLTHQIGFLSPTIGTVAAGWAVSLTTFAARARADRHRIYCRPIRPETRGLRQLYRADAWDGDFGDSGSAPDALPRVCVVWSRCREYDITSRPVGSAGVSKPAFRPDCQPSCRDQPVQFRVWTELTRPARTRSRQLQHRVACLPVDGSTGGAHCHLARGNSLQEGVPSQRLGIQGLVRAAIGVEPCDDLIEPTAQAFKQYCDPGS